MGRISMKLEWIFPSRTETLEEDYGEFYKYREEVLNFFDKKNEGHARDFPTLYCGDLFKELVSKGLLVKEGRKDNYYVQRQLWDGLKKTYEKDKIPKSSVLINNIETKCKASNIDFDADKIKNNKKVLIEYLENIIGIYSSIYSLRKRYDELYFQRKTLLLESVKESIEVDNILSKDVADLEKQIKQIVNRINDTPTMEQDIIVPIPSKPQKPVFSLEQPIEPLYKTPGFLNKKKIMTENEALRNSYNEELSAFYEQKEIFERQLDEYKNKLKLYKVELEQCKAEEERLNNKAYNKKLKEYENNKSAWLLQKEQLEKELKALKANNCKKREQLLGQKEASSLIKKIEYEISYIFLLLEKLIETKNQLFGYNVVYEKYRDYIVITMLCDYLKAGRCDGLEGPNGAYNIYEQESRADIIINRLDTVIESLEEIKEIQYLIYTELQGINMSLGAIKDQLLVNNLLNATQIAQLDEIAFNTNATAHNTAVTAYNTAVTAYYSEKNAQLTTALLFTNMLSGL